MPPSRRNSLQHGRSHVNNFGASLRLRTTASRAAHRRLGRPNSVKPCQKFWRFISFCAMACEAARRRLYRQNWAKPRRVVFVSLRLCATACRTVHRRLERPNWVKPYRKFWRLVLFSNQCSSCGAVMCARAGPKKKTKMTFGSITCSVEPTVFESGLRRQWSLSDFSLGCDRRGSR